LNASVGTLDPPIDRAAPAPFIAPRARLIFLARLLLCLPFIISGIAKLFAFGDAATEVRSLTGLEPAPFLAALLIATQLGGSAATLAGGGLAWIGAAALAGFTSVATVLVHGFRDKAGTERMRGFNTCWEQIGLIGGLILAALIARRTRP
jgi:uncharacterized membrane protein YphA (DoxX/SURF4 family)